MHQPDGKVGVCMATSGAGGGPTFVQRPDRGRIHEFGADRRDHRQGRSKAQIVRTVFFQEARQSSRDTLPRPPPPINQHN